MGTTNFLTVFIFVSPVVLNTWLAFSMQKNPKRMKLLICILAAALVAGLRANTVGNDTIGYFRMFESYGEWGYIREPAFLLYIKVFMGITHSAQACIFITAFITNGLILTGFWKLHEQVSFPSMMFAYMCSTFFLTMSGMRQWLSLSIICYGFHYLLEKKYIKYLIVVLIAMMFHYSTIVAITYLGIAILLSNTGKLNAVKLIRNMAVLFVCGGAMAAGYMLISREYQGYVSIPEYESRAGLLTIFRFLIFALFVAASLLTSKKRRGLPAFMEESAIDEPSGAEGMDKLLTMLAAVGFLIWMLSAYASQFMLNVGRIGWVFLISEGLLFSRFTKGRSNLFSVGKYAMIFMFLYILYKTITVDGNGLLPYSFFWMRLF
jgi:hypothetical protein